jgi:hypothetical protein
MPVCRELDLLEKLVADFPNVPAYWDFLGEANGLLAGVLLKAGQYREAR